MCLFVLAAAAILLLVAGDSIAASPDKRIAVILSRDIAASREALQGFTETVPHRIVAQHELTGDAKQDAEIIAKVHSVVRPDLIFSVGTAALEAVVRSVRDIPVVYAMVLNPPAVIPPDATNVTGASMNVAPARVMQVFKEFEPRIQRVGVVFDPEHTRYLVDEATRETRDRGLQLISRGARSTREAVQALESMKGRVDALWMVPDPTVLADAFTTAMFLFSYRNNIPVVGLSRKDTDRGAIVSLGFGSSRDIGKQAGEIANSILGGKKPAEVRYTMARQVQITVNPRGARKLGVEIPASLIATASKPESGLATRPRSRKPNIDWARIEAPVYHEGDWWVFRHKRPGQDAEDFRVSYRNGTFEVNDARFSEHRHLPALVHFNEAEKQTLKFPLLQGKQWSFRFKDRNIAGRRIHPIASAKVVGAVRVRTPAGEFEAIEIERTDTRATTYEDIRLFYSPETRSAVQLTARVSAGRYYPASEQEFELVAYGSSVSESAPAVTRTSPASNVRLSRVEAPKPLVSNSPGIESVRGSGRKIDWSRIEAPVYEEGDWWVYRISFDGSTSEHRVEYKNGRFESDGPDALQIGDAPVPPGFLPWATVHLQAPHRNWLDFPLTPGKQWQFSYDGRSNRDGLYRILADAEVIGPAPHIGTAAGTFDTIEILRTDTAHVWAVLNYFYSPEAKSVVKLTAKHRFGFVGITGISHHTYNLELVRYGRKTQNFAQAVAKTTARSTPAGHLASIVDSSSVGAPVFADGDWWTFRVKTKDEAQTYNFVRRNGVFESDIAFFTGKPSMVLSGGYPAMRHVQFPLEPGKTWNSRYPGPLTEFAFLEDLSWRASVIETAGEVVGVKPELIETPAGAFEVVEVRPRLRNAGSKGDRKNAAGNAELEFTGFYSPEAKCMVKLIGELKGPGGSTSDRMEIELVAYGKRQ